MVGLGVPNLTYEDTAAHTSYMPQLLRSERERELEKRTFFTFLQRGFVQNLSELILFIITLNLICFRLFFFF